MNYRLLMNRKQIIEMNLKHKIKYRIKKISYVMKIKNQNRIKKNKSPPQIASQRKSKSKTKPKNFSFNPLQYLNALIELTNEVNPAKQKNYKLPQKRDLSSAMTIATPAMQKTISTTKIRCKSSYSQYRKKSNLINLKQVLNLNLNNYINTEQEDASNCIKFTSVQSSHNSLEQTPTSSKGQPFLKQIKPQIKHQKPTHSHDIDYNHYARKIQRAWKSFQTYKVISKYYRHFKKQKKQLKKRPQNQIKLQFKPRHPNYQRISQKQQNPSPPSVQAYLSNYYDIPPASNNYLLSAHEELLQRTVKFKIKSTEQNFNHQISSNQPFNQLKCEDSESQNQLNLTQKLNQIKQFIEKQSKNQCHHLPDFSQAPTIEIKKSVLPQPYHNCQNFDSAQRISQKNNSQENQSTQKKLNQALNIKIPNKLQQNGFNSDLTQFNLARQLDRSPTLKEDFRSSLKTQNHKNYELSHKKHPSLVDSMIRKETEKYNEILSLIQFRKTDKMQQNQNSSSILQQLMKKLEQHKSQLQEGKKPNEKQTNKRGMSQRSVRQGSQCGNNSFLAFQSKDIYNSFENYEFESEEKRTSQKDQEVCKKGKSGPQLEKDKVLEQNNSKKVVNFSSSFLIQDNSCEKQELLQRFSSLLDLEQQKLSEFINKNKKNSLLQFEELSSSVSSLKCSINNSQVNDDSFKDLKQSINQDKNVENGPIIADKSFSEEGSQMYSFRSIDCGSDEINKMFCEHMNLIAIKKDRSVKNLINLIDQNKINKDLFGDRLNQIEQRFQTQRKQIQTKKKLYIKSIHSVKRQALKFQKQLISSAKKQQEKDQFREFDENDLGKQRSFGIRKSFSAQSIVLKCILKQPLLNTKKTLGQLMKRQQNIRNFDDSSDEDQSERQNWDDEDKKQRESQDEQSEKKEEESPLRQNINNGTKIVHKQKTNESSLVNEFQNISQLLHPKITDLNGHDTLLECVESKQLKKQRSLNEKQAKEKIAYFQCEQVWIKQSITQINKAQLNSTKPPQSLQEELDADHFSSLPQVEDAKSQTEDELLIQDHLDESLQSQEQSLEHPSPNTSQCTTHASSTALMQRYSQELEQYIESQLINQVIETVYLNDSMLTLCKPFIEQIFQFTPINDSVIFEFIHDQLPKHFPSFSQLIQRANQKINPTSIQILRLVRDFDYQIDQYELILSEDIFKSARKSIEANYAQKVEQMNTLPTEPKISFQNNQVLAKAQKRQTEKRIKIQKYLGYERDMKIMYMKAVFNCLNEFLIEQKSIATHVNARSTIGTGQLSLSIKQFNIKCSKKEVEVFFAKSEKRIKDVLRHKCMLPSFKSHKDVSLFQKQMLLMIKQQLNESEYRWVTYMDEVLEIWNQVANGIAQEMILEATKEIILMKQTEQKCE